MKKIKSKSGMTLTELLCGIVVLLLITSLLTVGARFAVKTYHTSMASSQAQTLCSTITTAVADKLRYCGNVSESGDHIFIRDVGSVAGDEQTGEVFTVNDAGEIMLGETKLLGSKSYPEGLQIKEFHLSYVAADRLFHVAFQVCDSAGGVLSSADFDVKRVNLNLSTSQEQS